MSGPYAVSDIANLGIGTYFSGISIGSTKYVDHYVPFGFVSQGFLIANRGSAIIEYSFNGVSTHGTLLASGSNEAALVFDKRHQEQIYLRAVNTLSGASIVRIEAW